MRQCRHEQCRNVGYARVSTGTQLLNLRQDALAATGCGKTFTESAGKAKTERVVFAETLVHLRPGDTLVVWRLDRLGRSLRHPNGRGRRRIATTQ